jgi:hypothetical protein
MFMAMAKPGNQYTEVQSAKAPNQGRTYKRLLSSAVLACVLAPSQAWACACGCSAFDLGTGSFMPQENDHGGRLYFEWDYMNQNKNRKGTSSFDPANNPDKKIETNYYNIGVQYMFNRDWGFMVRMPFATRSFKTSTDSGDVVTYHDDSVGDIEVMGMYTGLTKDMSLGLMFGLKLPTGEYTAPNFDRDTQIGSGSTDLVLGAFYRGMITGDNAWQYFTQVKWLQPIAYSSSWDNELGAEGTYKPGAELDWAGGISYNNLYKVAGFDKITPVLQFIGSHRDHDSGTSAKPDETGYDRVLIAPGIEFTKVLDEQNNKVFKLYGDVEIPIFYRVRAAEEGQLVSPYLVKLIASYNF